jgi:hypothetical protein
VLAAVFQQAHDLQPAMGLLKGFQNLPCVVGTAIIHDDDFKVLVRLSENRFKSFYQDRQ